VGKSTWKSTLTERSVIIGHVRRHDITEILLKVALNTITLAMVMFVLVSVLVGVKVKHPEF
jgi:hypothetical protein